MTTHLKTLLAVAALLVLAPQAEAVVRTTVPSATETIDAEKLEKEAARNARKEARRKKLRERLEQKRDKLVHKLEKKGIKIGQKEGGKSIWRTFSFILGLILFVGGIILGIIALSNPLGGFFHFLAGLLVVAGIVLILFSVLKGSPPPNP